MADNNNCPCGSGKAFEDCCEPFLIGKKQPPTAEALMRARYSAYALGSIDYLYESSGPKIRKQFDAEGSRRWSESAEWTGLEVVSTEEGGEADEKGAVEFIAHYTIKDKSFDHHEVSTFQKIDGKWRFIDGKIIGPDPIKREEPKIGRNDPCPCGSGKKYKKCCGADK
ncbi:MAG: YchJ family protein [Kiritimatiellae bacterium]|nr:YchJ family protein [Kiritimatiellia bacterium]